MKLLFVLEYYYPNIGGVEKLFKSLAEELVAHRHDVTIVTTRFDKNLAARETINGVNIVRLNLRNRFFFTFFSLPVVMKYARLADIIHTTSYNAALQAFVASKLLRKKVIITFNEVWNKFWFTLPFLSTIERFAFYRFEQLLLKLSFDKFIAVSDYTFNCLIHGSVKPSKVKRIYNGIVYQAIAKEAHAAPKDFVYTYFGRLGVSKGLDVLLEAARDFQKQYPAARLKMIIPLIPASFYKKIVQLIENYQLNDSILLLHNLSPAQLEAELLTSSCVVIPSYTEGFCFAAVETIALGVPIIYSSAGALAETVSGVAIKLPELNSKELTIALTKAINNEWSKTPVKRFELKDTVGEYLKMYEEV